MVKVKKKLTADQKSARKRAKKERQEKFTWVFMSSKQVRVKRHPQTIDGVDVDEYIEQYTDPFWLHQNEMWEHIDTKELDERENQDDQDFLF